MSTIKTSLQQASVLPARFLIVAALVIGTMGVASAQTLPCDIYAAGGTACVAAHSTTRALFGAYGGRLYQVKRASDGATADVSTLAAGGYANAAAQDAFCAGTTCIITIIYDQSSQGEPSPRSRPPAAPVVPTSARTRPRCRRSPAATRSTASTSCPGWVTGTSPRREPPATARPRACTW